jgi:hypothetical protein
MLFDGHLSAANPDSAPATTPSGTRRGALTNRHAATWV